MMCDTLTAFVDGELDEQQASEFRRHIDGCIDCQDRLVGAVQLSARLAGLKATPEDYEAVGRDFAAVGDDIQRAAAKIADSGTTWTGLPRPESFTEPPTKVERRPRPIVTTREVVLIAISCGVSLTTSILLYRADVPGAIIGVAAQFTGITSFLLMTRRRNA